MLAKTITVFNSKGGCGKTTVAMNLAGALGRRGFKVLVVDMDKQGTATRWFAQAKDGKEFPAQVSNLYGLGGTVHRELKNKIKDFHFVIVDCPPAIESAAPSSALLVSDMAIVPFIPSVPDMWAVGDVDQLIERASVTNEGLKARLLATQKIRSSIGEDVIFALQENTGLELMASSLRQLAAFRECIDIGGTVHDVMRAEKAISDIESLVDEVLQILEVESK